TRACGAVSARSTSTAGAPTRRTSRWSFPDASLRPSTMAIRRSSTAYYSMPRRSQTRHVPRSDRRRAMDRSTLMLVVIGFLVLLLALMYLGWRARRGRQHGVPAPRRLSSESGDPLLSCDLFY